MRQKNLITIAYFEPKDVLPFIGDEKKEYFVDGVPYLVKMNSLRYITFAKSISCVICGLEGTIMALERFPADRVYHFNLYARQEEHWMLFTKDHILPRCQGGTDHPDNLQTMCSYCNRQKGGLTPAQAVLLEKWKSERNYQFSNTECRRKIESLIRDKDGKDADHGRVSVGDTR